MSKSKFWILHLTLLCQKGNVVQKCTITAKGLTRLLWSWSKKVVNTRISHLKARAHEVKAPLRLKWPKHFTLLSLCLFSSSTHSKSDICLGPGGNIYCPPYIDSGSNIGKVLAIYKIDLVKEGSFTTMDWLRVKLWIGNRTLFPAAQNNTPAFSWPDYIIFSFVVDSLAGGEEVNEGVEEGDEAEGVLVVCQPELVKGNCQGYEWGT